MGYIHFGQQYLPVIVSSGQPGLFVCRHCRIPQVPTFPLLVEGHWASARPIVPDGLYLLAACAQRFRSASVAACITPIAQRGCTHISFQFALRMNILLVPFGIRVYPSQKVARTFPRISVGPPSCLWSLLIISRFLRFYFSLELFNGQRTGCVHHSGVLSPNFSSGNKAPGC